MSPSSIPKPLALAVIAVEDERFYSDSGVDLIGVARALGFDAQHGCWCEGASTITQQLVKLLYLGGSDKGTAKLVDGVIAVKVSEILSKPDILADYLSLIPTGPNLYGVNEASCEYFGRPLAELDLPEYALLAGLAQAPFAYDPLEHQAAALRRRSDVLSAMVAEKYVTQEQAAVANAAPYQPPSRRICQA